MSRLDGALGRLAERGDPIGAGLLLERLERQLTSESVPGVVALETGRRAMEPTPTTEEKRTVWPGSPRVAAGLAAATIAVVFAGLAIFTLSDSDQPFAADDGLSVTEAYFEEFNAGDVDALLGLFAPGVELSDSFEGSWTVADWEMIAVWNIAQGSTLTSPICTVTGQVPGESVTVSCESETNNAQVQAVGAPSVPTRVTTTVTPEGISSFRFDYGVPDFLVSTDPFDRWMRANHPQDVGAVGFGNWTTVEEAQQNGTLTAEYAADWASYLEANSCDYRMNC